MMLTKKGKSKNWKYLAILPVLCISSLLMAQAGTEQLYTKINRARLGDITQTNGNSIKWQPIEYVYDSIQVQDPLTGTVAYSVQKGMKDSHVIELNGEAVKQIFIRDPRTKKALRGYDGIKDFTSYVSKEFKKSVLEIPTHIDYIEITNAVFDKNENLVYYQLVFGQSGINMTKKITNEEYTYYTDLVDKIIPKYKYHLEEPEKGLSVYMDFIGTIIINEVNYENRIRY